LVSAGQKTAQEGAKRQLLGARRARAVISASWQTRRRENMLPYYAYLVSEALVRVLPQRTSYWLGNRVADVLMLAAPRKLDALRDNLRHVLPNIDERALQRVVRHNLHNLTHSWVDVMAMSSRRTNLPSRIDIEGFANFGQALRRRRGVVVVSMHYGSWEAGLAGWNAMGGRIALLAEVLHPQQLFDRVIGARGKQNVQVIPIDVAAMRQADTEMARRIAAASMREVFRLLRSGGVVAMALDRDLIGNGELIPFFSKPAPIPVGVVDTAIRTGAAIVPIILYRNDRRVRAVLHPELTYDPNAPREEEVRRVTREVLALFERVILEHPDQWHVLDRIWPEALNR
jgi:KDO2-lipid IV(A) lauroyltransferase